MEKDYSPIFTAIGGDRIYENSDMKLENLRCGYFADTNCRVQIYADYVSILDLSNAMTTGKECIERRFVPTDQNLKSATELTVTLMNQKIKTIAVLCSAKEIEGFDTHEHSKKAVNVFSPFVEAKPIPHPAKWTRTHVAKAILAGQIFDGITKGSYTDDYAYDASENFGIGKQLDLINVARDLIESGSSGLRIYEDGQKDGITQISLNTYSYNYKTLYFDVDCNHLLKEQRNTEKQRNLENQNQQAKSQVLKLAENEILGNEIYQITYLTKNKNTGELGSKGNLIFGSRLFYEGGCKYDVLTIEPLEITDDNLYTLSDFSCRPLGEQYEGDRIIALGNFQRAVSGYSLKQLLEEGTTFPMIKIADPKTVELAKEFCQKNIEGTIRSFMSGEDTNWSESLKRLETDEQRMNVERDTPSWGFDGPSMG